MLKKIEKIKKQLKLEITSAVTDNLISNVKYKVEEFAGLPVERIGVYVEGVRVID